MKDFLNEYVKHSTCSMDKCYYPDAEDCFECNKKMVVAHDKQIKAETLDEFLNMLPDCDYVGIESLVCLAERLKEQKNE